MTNNKPRQHHYIPKSYLAGFTKTEKINGKIFVFDQKSFKNWVTKPNKIAKQRDFYRLDSEKTIDEFAIERILGEFESVSIPVLKKIKERKQLPVGEEFNLLLNLMSLMIVRTPHTRKMIVEPLKQIQKVAMQYTASDKDLFDKTIKKIKESGHEIDDSIDYEQFKEFVMSKKVNIKLGQNFLIKIMVDSVDILLPLLGKRSWSLLITESDDTYFISSEHPVSITWSDGKSTFPPPGFGHKNTDVCFPINKRMAIIGCFEPLDQTRIVDPETVASINNRTAQWGGRFIFGAHNKIKWLNENGFVRDKKELIEYLKKKRSHGD